MQLAYAIGVAEPVSVRADSFGTAEIGDRRIEALIREHFPMSPAGIMRYLDLRRPIYRQTAAYGHFGRDEKDFTWEDTSRAAVLREAAGLEVERVSSLAQSV